MVALEEESWAEHTSSGLNMGAMNACNPRDCKKAGCWHCESDFRTIDLNWKPSQQWQKLPGLQRCP
ncbi:hypothetical protein EYF80_040367 [Liparis tanakae]|uniref:Uncharacterized protein n=1 Tax=Liparis tanakae TaxID=230148 RepID=A0A4Z2GA38_9TELE|nr:hypothetical protein EYF80_040367 [Liparis tanakae]